MPVQQASFPLHWFATEAGPQSSSEMQAPVSPRNQQEPTSRKTPARDFATMPAGNGEDDLDVTADLVRRDSFSFVLDLARAREGLEPADPAITRPKSVAVAGRGRPAELHGADRRDVQICSPVEMPKTSEVIELANLPRFTRAGDTVEMPRTLPKARLPRR
jgi:hypothetical protein